MTCLHVVVPAECSADEAARREALGMRRAIYETRHEGDVVDPSAPPCRRPTIATYRDWNVIGIATQT